MRARLAILSVSATSLLVFTLPTVAEAARLVR